MKKILMLAMVIGFLVSNICYAQSGKEAVRALQKLQARVETGISYRDYAPALGDAKFEVKLFLRSPEAKENQSLASKVEKAMFGYELASSVWTSYFSNRSDRQGIRYTVPDPSAIFPELAGEISTWNASIKRNRYSLTLEQELKQLLNVIWSETGKELEKAITLLLNG